MKTKDWTIVRTIVEKYVRSMVFHGFCHGVMGDVSEQFISAEIEYILEHIDTWAVRQGVADSVSNLVQYCDWTRKDIEIIAFLFGFEIVERPDLIAKMSGVLKPGEKQRRLKRKREKMK